MEQVSESRDYIKQVERENEAKIKELIVGELREFFLRTSKVPYKYSHLEKLDR